MALEWTSDLETGIEVIDNQHNRIVEYINNLENAIATNDRGEVGRVLDELVDYSLSHFSFEESLLNEANYRLAKPHKAVHDMFSKRLSSYQERFKAGEDVAGRLYTMIHTWLFHHIKRDDMAYVKDVKANIYGIVTETHGESWLGRALARFFS